MRGHGRACGAAEHSGRWLPLGWKMPIFSMFLFVFLAQSLNAKNGVERQRAFFGHFWALPLNVKNEVEGQRAFLVCAETPVPESVASWQATSG